MNLFWTIVVTVVLTVAALVHAVFALAAFVVTPQKEEEHSDRHAYDPEAGRSSTPFESQSNQTPSELLFAQSAGAEIHPPTHA